MKCKEIQLQQLLSDYVSGHLSTNDISRIDQHISGCAECRKILNVMIFLTSAQADYKENIHPGPDELAHFVFLDKQFTAERRKEIAAHILSCGDCSAGADFLKGLDEDVEKLLHLDQGRVDIRGKKRFLLLFAFRKPALAYLLLLFFAYPAFLGLRQLISEQKIVASQTYDLKEMRRSVASIIEVGRLQGDSVVRLQIPLYHLATERKYSFVVTNSSHTVQTLQYISDFSMKGRVGLLLDTKPLSDGTYFLIINEVDPQSPNDTLQRSFPFKLLTGE